jgi:hypothetical protein
MLLVKTIKQIVEEEQIGEKRAIYLYDKELTKYQDTEDHLLHPLQGFCTIGHGCQGQKTHPQISP